MPYTTDWQTYDGALLALDLLSGSQTILLGAFGGMQTGQDLVLDSDIIYVGETVQLSGEDYLHHGSGTAQPGIELLGLVIPTGTAVDVLILSNSETGQIVFVYPDGTTNLLSGIAVIVNVEAVPYNFAAGAPVCFVRGTLLDTPRGPLPVQKLRAGDAVLDMQGRRHRILLADHSVLRAGARGAERHAPVRIPAGFYGEGCPERRLRVSPQHRVPLPGHDAETGAPVLVSAKALIGFRGVRQEALRGDIHYFHVLLRRHVLLRAEGMPAESLFPGRMALRAMPRASVARIAALLGVPEEALPGMPPAGLLLPAGKARRMLQSAA